MTELREASKCVYTTVGHDANHEEIRTGCLQRMADALETVSSRYKQLQDECNRYERYYRNEQERAERLLRKNAALRGVITRMKNKKL